MARNPIYDILNEPEASAPAAADRNPIYDILPAKDIVIPKGVMRFGGRSGSEENFRMLRPQVQEELIAAAQEYYQKTGKPLQVNSGFRSVEDQKRLYDESVAAGRPGVGPTGMPIAKPGSSKHNQGVVVDIQQGKDDPIAQQILSGRGFTQNVKNDPVHFEYVGSKTQPQVTAPTALVEEAPPPQAPQPEPIGPMRTAQAGLAGITQGTLAGLGQYPAAGLLALASRVAPQGAPLTYEQSLQQVRESQQSLQQEAPLAYAAGQVGGSVAGFGKLAGIGTGARTASIVRPAAVATGMGATSKYTESPETTIGQSATQGGIEGGLTLAGGAIGRGVEKGLGKIGKSQFVNTLKNLVNAGTAEADQALNRIMTPIRQNILKKAELEKPVLGVPKGIKPEKVDGDQGLNTMVRDSTKRTQGAASVIEKHKKKVAAWEKRNAEIMQTDNATLAERYIKNPDLFRKYTSADPKTEFGRTVAKSADKILAAQRSAAGAQTLAQTALTVGGGGLGGAGIGGLYGLATGQDPYATALTGGGLGSIAMPYGRYLASSQYLRPTTMQPLTRGLTAATYGATQAGEATGITLSDLLNTLRRDNE